MKKFWQDEGGQDLIEYTLLMAFVALASAALFLAGGGSIKSIWTTSNTQLSTAEAKGGWAINAHPEWWGETRKEG